MACCLPTPSHYLDQFWFIISQAQSHSSEGNFTMDTSAITQSKLKNYLSKMSLKAARGEFVNINQIYFRDSFPESSTTHAITENQGTPLHSLSMEANTIPADQNSSETKEDIIYSHIYMCNYRLNAVICTQWKRVGLLFVTFIIQDAIIKNTLIQRKIMYSSIVFIIKRVAVLSSYSVWIASGFFLSYCCVPYQYWYD